MRTSNCAPGSIAHLYPDEGRLSLALGRIGQVLDDLFELAGFRTPDDATNSADGAQRQPREEVN